MAVRAFLIIDDIPVEGRKVNVAITKFYEARKISGYNIILCIGEMAFSDAQDYISRGLHDVDVIFSDFHLRTNTGKTGIDLFEGTNKRKPTEYESIWLTSQLYKVLHSNVDERFKQLQSEHKKKYHHFINSSSDGDIDNFFEIYEKEIVEIKQKGNKVYREILHQKAKEQLVRTRKIWLDERNIALEDVLVCIRDNEDTKGEYYHFFYFYDQKLERTTKSIKPTGINSDLRDLGFISGTLAFDNNLRFKINPLWIAGIDLNTSTIKLIPKKTWRLNIKFKSLENFDAKLIDQQINEYFIL